MTKWAEIGQRQACNKKMDERCKLIGGGDHSKRRSKSAGKRPRHTAKAAIISRASGKRSHPRNRGGGHWEG